MNLDLLVCGLVLFFAVLGALAGGAMQLTHLVALAIAGAVCRPVGLRFGVAVAHHQHWPDIAGVIAVTVLAFFATYAVVQVVFRMVLKVVLKSDILGAADKALGFGLGGAKAAFILYVLLSALIFFEKPIAQVAQFRFDTKGSRVADFVRAHDLFTDFSFPGTQGLSVLARVTQDPNAAMELGKDPQIAALTKDPRVQALLRDGELQRALQSGDTLALLKSDRVLNLMADPAVQARLEHVGETVTPPAPTPRRGSR